jgi:hypothetical protein
MNWIKHNLGMLLCGVAFVALLGLAGWQIHQAIGRRREIESTLRDKQDSIQTLRSAKIFPSKENIEALRHDRLQLLQLYSNIQNKVTPTGIIPPPIKRDAEFNLFLVETQSGLRKAVSGSNTNLDSQAFGFDRYREAYPCRAANLRTGSDCENLLNTLAKQIIVVDKITRMIFESGTDALIEVKRAQVAAETPGTDTLPWTPPTDPKALFVTMPFRFKFACETTDVLQNFLNKLTQADLFLVLKNLTIETEAQIVGDPNQPTARIEPTSDATAKKQTKHRLIVTARIDWVEFAAATNKTTATTK